MRIKNYPGKAVQNDPGWLEMDVPPSARGKRYEANWTSAPELPAGGVGDAAPSGINVWEGTLRGTSKLSQYQALLDELKECAIAAPTHPPVPARSRPKLKYHSDKCLARINSKTKHDFEKKNVHFVNVNSASLTADPLRFRNEDDFEDDARWVDEKDYVEAARQGGGRARQRIPPMKLYLSSPELSDSDKSASGSSSSARGSGAASSADDLEADVYAHLYKCGRTSPVKSSGKGRLTGDDFLIPRPRLVVPVHSYGVRKRKTGNLVSNNCDTTANCDNGEQMFWNIPLFNCFSNRYK